jgi:hypothetical protein
MVAIMGSIVKYDLDVGIDDWASELDKALTSFVIVNSKTQWSASDLKKIKEVVQELGLAGARFAFNSSHVYDVDEEKIWMRDQGVLHMHPTMLVATRSFSGSVDRGEKPYPLHRHFYPFSNFTDKSSSSTSDKHSNDVLCPKLGYLVPAGFECMCGEIHTKH